MRLILASILTGLLLLGSACEDAPRDDVGTATFDLEVDLAPGQEAHFCRYVRMPAPSVPRVFVRGGHHLMSDGSHHYLLYRTRLTQWDDAMAKVVPCDEHGPVMESATSYVTGGQTLEADSDFPAAAALGFAPGEILLLQGHFVNASRNPKKARVDLVLRTVNGDAVEKEAGVLRFYDPFIVVEPRGKSTAKMRCTIKSDVMLLTAAAHMHAHGVAFRAFVDPPNGPPSTTPFYTTADGLHPTFYAGFMPLAKGSAIRFECDYANKEDRTVLQGLSATKDEMCMLSAFYYPAMPPGDEACEDMHDHGTGTATCAATTTCLESCAATDRPDFARGDPRVGECWQRCITSSCPNVTRTLFPQLQCTDARCKEECKDTINGREACRVCVATRCAAEWSACERLACAP